MHLFKILLASSQLVEFIAIISLFCALAYLARYNKNSEIEAKNV